MKRQLVWSRRCAAATVLAMAATGAAVSPAVATAASSAPVCQNTFGTKTPVLLVHGFHEGTDVWASITKAIQPGIPGVAVVTPFDYPDTHWVNDPGTGPKLAREITCLAGDSKTNGGPGKVIIVAHSMGGLAVRCVVTPKCGGPDSLNAARRIGLLITLGTPNTGSALATAGNVLSDVGQLACQVIVALQTGVNLSCPDLLGWLFGANSPAAKAMAVGLDSKPSPALSALPPLPSSVPLDAIAGQVTITTSLFDLPPLTVTGPALGDLVVSQASALDGAPPTSPAHPGRNVPHPGPGSGTVTVPCGTVSIEFLAGLQAPSVVPAVTCWHLTETTDSAWEADVLTAIRAAASAFGSAPCTPAALTSAINAAKAESPGNWRLTYHACKSGYAFIGIQPFQGLAVVAILKQLGTTWKIIYGPNEGLCLAEPLPSFCQGFKLPIPWAVLRSLMPQRTAPQKTSPSGPTPPAPPPPVSTTVQVTVPANAGWVDTGVALSPNDAVDISASGSWTADGVNYTGPDGYSTESPDNYINLSDLGACAVCATTPYPEWGALMSYIGSLPPQPGSYTSTSVAPQAMRVDYVGSVLNNRSWPVSGELWLAMNDDAYSGNTSDNYGQVTATVTVHRP